MGARAVRATGAAPAGRIATACERESEPYTGPLGGANAEDEATRAAKAASTTERDMAVNERSLINEEDRSPKRFVGTRKLFRSEAGPILGFSMLKGGYRRRGGPFAFEFRGILRQSRHSINP